MCVQCCLGWGLPPYQSLSWCIQPFGHNRHGLKIGGCPPFLGGSWVICNTMSPGPMPTSVQTGITSRLATIDMGRKLAGSAPFLGEVELGPHLMQCCLDRGLPPYRVAFWSIQSFCHNRYGRKLAMCLFGGGELVPLWHTVARGEAYLHAKFCLDPSNRLAAIHQRYRHTDR